MEKDTYTDGEVLDAIYDFIGNGGTLGPDNFEAFMATFSETVGECDECGAKYEVWSREGRCGDCGYCSQHCEHVDRDVKQP
jgi:hypothetical protein